MARPDSTSVPQLPGDYRATKLLGKGNFGEVWNAHAPGGIEVAVKVIQRTVKPEEAARELEALQLMKRLRHQGLLGVQAFFSLEDQLVIVLELADRSLRQRLAECQQEGKAGIPATELLRYLAEAAEALDYLHENQVQHRDIKPDNILLLGRHAKVADYGLARVLEKQALQTATTIGTPSFMAPEVWHGKISEHTDQYSLAVTYVQMVSGQLPFDADSLVQLMCLHLNEPPRLEGFAEAERKVLLRALAKEPGARYPSCKAFVRALVQVVRQQSGKPAGPAVRPELASTKSKAPSAQDPWRTYVQSAPRQPPAGLESTDPVPRRPVGDSQGPWRMITAILVGVVLLLSALLGAAIWAYIVRDRGGPVAGGASSETGERGPPPTVTAAGAPDQAGTGRGSASPLDTRPVRPPVPPMERPALLDCTGERGASVADVLRAQQSWAAFLGQKAEESVSLGGGLTMEFMLIPPGTFTMGSPTDEKDRFENEVAHYVTLTRPFFITKYPVTQEQYERLIGKNPSWFSATGGGKDKVQGLDTSRFPVETVSWEEAETYCQRLGQQTGRKASLPTEAQWEYACRAGTTTPFWFGTMLNGTEANCDGSEPYGTLEKGPYLERTCPVRSYQANAFGLYSMHGNVWQWCQDWYADYDANRRTDPEGLATGDARVLRGGSCFSGARICRAASRLRNAPSSYLVGFRVVLRLE